MVGGYDGFLATLAGGRYGRLIKVKIAAEPIDGPTKVKGKRGREVKHDWGPGLRAQVRKTGR